MNEGLEIFINDEGTNEEDKALVKKIDELLWNFGITYTGVNNIYRPLEAKNRDNTLYAACRALQEADWLKDRLAYISIMNWVDTCPIERIQVEHMSEISAVKLEYYENYYQKFHKLAHGIVIDECRQLRDGYASYMLAKRYGLHPDIYVAFSEQPLKKTVRGQHITGVGDSWKVKSRKIYTWNYSLKSPVVPGDILKVETKNGQGFICVRDIAYITGKSFCKEHRNVIKHMKKRLPPVG